MADLPAPTFLRRRHGHQVTLYIQATVMEQSLHVWVDTEPVLKTLSIALPSEPVRWPAAQ